MTLIQVKSMGTEGRRDGQNEIQGLDNEIDEVNFKVDHIKDFRIIEKPYPSLIDPAIISISSQPKTTTETTPKKPEQSPVGTATI